MSVGLGIRTKLLLAVVIATTCVENKSPSEIPDNATVCIASSSLIVILLIVLIVGGALTGVPNVFSKAPASAVVATEVVLHLHLNLLL